VLLSLLLVTACNQQNNNPATVRQSPPQATATETPRQPAPPPTEAELRAVVKKNYEDVVTIDESRPTPFMIGDFNGDTSEDIAIVVSHESCQT